MVTMWVYLLEDVEGEGKGVGVGVGDGCEW